MTDDSHNLYTPAQVAELDRRAIETHGIPGGVLMAKAGRMVWRLIRQRHAGAGRLLVLCGGGNNGGDGYVIARLAAESGLTVDLCAMSDPSALGGDARQAATQALECVRPVEFSAARLGRADVVVDALLGTGLDRPVEGAMAEIIKAVNASDVPVVAVDIPSGLNGATGRVMGVAIQADLTPTFIGRKQGLYTGDAADYVGEVVFDDLQVPQAVYVDTPVHTACVGGSLLRQWLVPRSRVAHKGECGHVLVVGGDHGTGGAVRIAGEAAARTGAGLVSIATRPTHVPALLAARPELMSHGIDGPAALDRLIEKADVVALGPGLGQQAWGEECLRRAYGGQRPLVVDADGLNLLARQPMSREQSVLTPHPGEAGRLLDVSVRDIQNDRFAAVDALARRYGGVVVLKGPGTVVGDGQQRAVVTEGNPGMASGGMGDALTGIVAGLLAQGADCWTAARLGALVHARAGDLAAVRGERGLLAGDLLSELRRVVNP